MSSRLIRTTLNKSFLTNMLAGMIIVFSYCFVNTPYAAILSNVGIFALSGALTNWIAIYMLFEKVPFLYGSGVIPTRFKEFKQGLRKLVLEEFFKGDGLTNIIAAQKPNTETWQGLADSLNYDTIYEALVDGIMTSSLGKMVAMFGGSEVVEPLRKPMQRKIHQAVSQMLSDEALQKRIMDKLQGSSQDAQFYTLIEKIVDNRLDTLTPKMVKEIIQKMIREHLGWLVVWGGVFGGLIGLTASFI